MDNVTIGLAFIAGILSFISPCVLPLVPAYIGYMGGRMTRNVALETSGGTGTTGNDVALRANMFLHGVAFVLGFTFIFVLLGVMTTALFSVLGSSVAIFTDIIGRAGGLMIIFFGLHFMGAIQWLFKNVKKRKTLLNNPLFSMVMAALISVVLFWALVVPVVALPVIALVLLALVAGGAFTSPGAFWMNLIERVELALYADTRQQMQGGENGSLIGSFMMGVVFSAGWTPCIGPLLGTILTLAANTGEVTLAIPLLTAYSLGLGIPFIITAILMDSARGLLRRLQSHMHTIELVSGGFLVAIGFLVASGQLTILTTQLNSQFADFSTTVEECGVGFFSGEIQGHQVGNCLNRTLLPVELRQGMDGTLNAEVPALQYLFHVEEAMAIDVELKDYPADFMPVVVILDSEDNEITRGEDLIPFDDDEATIVTNAELPAAGYYRAEITTTNVADDAEFRLKIVAAEEREPYPAEAQNADDSEETDETNEVDSAVVILGSGSVGGDDGNAEDNATTDLALDGIGGLSDFADDDSAAYGRDEGDLAFNFSMPTDDRGDVTLSDYRGKIVILNFWGTWCGPCRREMPELQSIYDEYSDDVEVVAVAARDTLEKIADFREELELTFVLGLDGDESISNRYAVPGRPTTFILDRDGIIRFQSFSLVTEAQVMEVIDEIMADDESIDMAE